MCCICVSVYLLVISLDLKAFLGRKTLSLTLISVLSDLVPQSSRLGMAGLRESQTPTFSFEYLNERYDWHP
jgi:hypothetical protein